MMHFRTLTHQIRMAWQKVASGVGAFATAPTSWGQLGIHCSEPESIGNSTFPLKRLAMKVDMESLKFK